MAHTIKVDEAALNQEFEDLLDDMYFRYHYHPTHIPHYNITSREQLQMAIHTEEAKIRAAQAEQSVNYRGGMQSDPNWCNGLPRNGGAVSGGKIK